MKLLIVQPHGLLPGPSCYTKEFCKALLDATQEVTLLTCGGLFAGAEEALDNPGRSYVHCQTTRHKHIVGSQSSRAVIVNKLITMYTNIVTINKAYKMLGKERYDIAHFVDAEIFTLIILNKLYGLPKGVYVTIRGYEFYGPPDDSIIKVTYRKLRKYFWQKHAPNIIAIYESPKVKESLLKDNKSVVKGHQIPHPVWFNSEAKEVTQSEARKSIGINYDGKILLIFGHRPFSQKAIDTIILALERVPKTFRVLIAGYEPDITIDEYLECLIKKVGWEDAVYRHFRYISESEAHLYFIACDALIISYRKYYMGSSGVLASACKYSIPVIASDKGDLGSCVKEYGVGLVFDAECSESLGTEISTFLSLKNTDIARMRINMQKFADERSWRNIVDLHLHAYAETTMTSKRGGWK